MSISSAEQEKFKKQTEAVKKRIKVATDKYNTLRKKKYDAGVCITVALFSLFSKHSLKDFNPHILSEWHGYTWFLECQRTKGYQIDSPESLSDFYGLLSSNFSRGALIFQPEHAFALIKIWNQELLEQQALLFPAYYRLDTAQENLLQTVSAIQLLELYEEIEQQGLHNILVITNRSRF